ncbi:hypothetical protein RB653_005822 [Dictyostelium firmibasis]|uniref:GATA-type domain-containing protein n=1 Tax=Dictyostelium firmibasis TaxID=79012 RepID=A0AAN7U207_9MYCE
MNINTNNILVFDQTSNINESINISLSEEDHRVAKNAEIFIDKMINNLKFLSNSCDSNKKRKMMEQKTKGTNPRKNCGAKKLKTSSLSSSPQQMTDLSHNHIFSMNEKPKRGRPPKPKPSCCQICLTNNTPYWRWSVIENNKIRVCNRCGQKIFKLEKSINEQLLFRVEIINLLNKIEEPIGK